ncbi:hypothetical protein FNV43_RR04080 [Rhamnella rubrinervis]|uniref:Uncharacterized protein n=1 Tax=Rhamnella rubrinervis TaxID=2594499 RepID=A0A8K0HK18_9ROSA|nr:hypothetical protein FNV43_RR04080 [Rhamnella rubrinervis]
MKFAVTAVHHPSSSSPLPQAISFILTSLQAHHPPYSLILKLLASGSLDGIIQIWDIALGNLKGTLDCPSGGIEMWNAASYLNMFSSHGRTVTCGDFTPES